MRGFFRAALFIYLILTLSVEKEFNVLKTEFLQHGLMWVISHSHYNVVWRWHENRYFKEKPADV